MLANSVSGGASVHRVPVVGPEGRVTKIIAQSRVISFLNEVGSSWSSACRRACGTNASVCPTEHAS